MSTLTVQPTWGGRAGTGGATLPFLLVKRILRLQHLQTTSEELRLKPVVVFYLLGGELCTTGLDGGVKP